MNGVKILSMMEVVTEYTSNWLVAGIIFIVSVIIGMVFGFCSYDGDVIGKILITIGYGVIGALMGMLFWLMSLLFTLTPTSYETQYKVTIDDSVSMNEFMDKYEVLDQEGQIYTVREKE